MGGLIFRYGGAKIKKDGGANGGAHFSNGKKKLFRAEGAPIFFSPPIEVLGPPIWGG